jgi:hypothetical protein
MPAIYARKNRTDIARGVFYGSALRLYNEKPTIIDNSSGVSAGILKVMKIRPRGVYFSRSRRTPESHLTLNGRNIPFVNSVKYLGVIFDKKVTWRL